MKQTNLGVWAISLAVLVAALCDCTGPAGRDRPAVATGSVSANSAQFDPLVTRDDSTRASAAALQDAIEDFLARTAHYESIPDGHSPEASPARQLAEQTASPTPVGRRIGSLAKRVVAAPITPNAPTDAVSPGTRANTHLALSEATRAVAAAGPALPVIQAVSIRSPVKSSTPAAKTKRFSTTNEPLDARPTTARLSAEEWLEDLRRSAEQTDDFATHWQLRLLTLAMEREGDSAQAVVELAGMDGRLLSALTTAAAAVRRAARNPRMVGQELIEDAASISRVLSEMADLTVTNTAFCKQVVTFGVYDEMAPSAFLAGRPISTIVYCEVRNFWSEPTPDGGYRTHLGTYLELLTADGEDTGWRQDDPEIVDRCRQRRSDFFLAKLITLPPTLPAGDYVMKVRVTDQLSGTFGASELRFTVHSPLQASLPRP